MKIFVQGLITMIPIAITVAVVVWLGILIESVVSMPFSSYIPSLATVWRVVKGVVGFVVLVFLFGLLMRLWLVRYLFEGVESRIVQIPLVKTVYSAIKDAMNMFGGKSGSKGDMVVMVTMENGWRQLGIVTRQEFTSFPPELLGDRKDWIAVYIPFSYQLGGFTYFLPRSACETVPGMSVEDAMRVSMMAWVGSDEKKTVAVPGMPAEPPPGPEAKG